MTGVYVVTWIVSGVVNLDVPVLLLFCSSYTILVSMLMLTTGSD